MTDTIDTGVMIALRRIRDVALIRPARSKKYKKWLRDKFPYCELHHVCGSVHGMKSSDYLLLPMTHEEHEQAQGESLNLDHIIRAIRLLMMYAEELEQ